MIRVAVSSQQQAVAIDKNRMRETVRTVLSGECRKNADISLAFVDNATIQTLNQRYLRHDEPTDVLSFPLEETSGHLVGELVIGAEIAVRQAQSLGHDIQAELALYLIHGLLHLCGYDDQTSDAAAKMRQRERYYLGQLGLPDIAPHPD
jgi:probable rRNA maturation factor